MHQSWILAAVLLLAACNRGDAPAPKPTEAAKIQPTVAVAPAPTEAPAKPTAAPPTSAPEPPTAKPAAPPPSGERVQVANAGADGVNMRLEASASSARVKGLVDGAQLEIIGGDVEADGRKWRNVKDPADGALGWVAAEFLGAPGAPRANPAALSANPEAPGAEKPAAPTPTTASAAKPVAPAPKPAAGSTCGSYASQAAAQAAYRANPTALRSLDGNDRDGVACENNPPPHDRVPVPR